MHESPQRTCSDDDVDRTHSGGGGNLGSLTRMNSFEDDELLMRAVAPDFTDVPSSLFGMLMDDADPGGPMAGSPTGALGTNDTDLPITHELRSQLEAPSLLGPTHTSLRDGLFNECISEEYMRGPGTAAGPLSGTMGGPYVRTLNLSEHGIYGSRSASAHDGAASSGACSVGSIGAAVVSNHHVGAHGGLATVYASSPL